MVLWFWDMSKGYLQHIWNKDGTSELKAVNALCQEKDMSGSRNWRERQSLLSNGILVSLIKQRPKWKQYTNNLYCGKRSKMKCELILVNKNSAWYIVIIHVFLKLKPNNKYVMIIVI